MENILQSIKPVQSEDNKNPAEAKLPGTTSVPSRFKLVNPKRKSLHDIVEQVTQETNPKNTNVKVFKQVAKSVMQANKDRDIIEEVTESDEQNDK